MKLLSKIIASVCIVTLATTLAFANSTDQSDTRRPNSKSITTTPSGEKLLVDPIPVFEGGKINGRSPKVISSDVQHIYSGAGSYICLGI